MSLKVAVLSGGGSEEQHSSRKSAGSVAQALEELGHMPVMVEYNANFANDIRNISPDAVFHIVQGKYHGDGAVQAVLELIGVPYAGSRPGAAAIINHKTLCKKLWHGGGIRTPEFFEYSVSEYRSDCFNDFKRKASEAGLSLPVVVKAPTQGGRYGIVFVSDAASFAEIQDAFRFDDVLLVERFVPGRFISQGIIEIDGKMTAMPPIEIIDDTDALFKLYTGRYADLKFSLTPDLEPDILEEISKTTLAAASLTGASSHARLDYHISGGELFLLEINAVPGLIRGFSHMTKCAEAARYDYPTFIGMILATARKG